MFCKDKDLGGAARARRPGHHGPAPQRPASLLLVDEDVEFSQMLSIYLRGQGFQVATEADGADGIGAALAREYDAIILGATLPSVDGIAVLRQIRRYRDVPVIMLTAEGSRAERIAGLELGADDYLDKPCDPRELAARLRAVLRRQARAGGLASALAMGGLVLYPQFRKAYQNEAALPLTAAEFNVLQLLLQAGGTVLSKDELTRHALGRRRESYDRSVDVHISKIRQKLHAGSGHAVEIETVRGVGYCLRTVS
ncbi:response regulator transcription factor [Massilia sp. MB5]|uniref:response regulator transcription factor n=1 Tax=Massilia sp. MB5 TaxID=2919578 RepID=UPI001F0E5B67|nr:response regulator transcription factor [Massilia sp. MB5]UMR32836.1 response regulator transcription factor [Massilia sp. MB5]